MPEVQRPKIVIHKSNLIMHCIFWALNNPICAVDLLGKRLISHRYRRIFCCTGKAGTQQAVDADLETRRSLWRQQADVGPGSGQGWMCLVGAVGVFIRDWSHPPIHQPKLWLRVATLQLGHACWNACRAVFWPLTLWPSIEAVSSRICWHGQALHATYCPVSQKTFFSGSTYVTTKLNKIEPLPLVPFKSKCTSLLFDTKQRLKQSAFFSWKMALGRGAELPVNPHVAKQLIYNWAASKMIGISSETKDVQAVRYKRLWLYLKKHTLVAVEKQGKAHKKETKRIEWWWWHFGET